METEIISERRMRKNNISFIHEITKKSHINIIFNEKESRILSENRPVKISSRTLRDIALPHEIWAQ